MCLITTADGRTIFYHSAIMRRAYELGRFALRLCRDAQERNFQRSHWLKRAWAEARRERSELARRVAQDAERRAWLEHRARESAALIAAYGHNRSAIEGALLRESMRDRMDFARVAQLEAALAALPQRHQLH